ncbi:unnamed protein product [Ilex paraguariensis]|uniref:Uncharacterized protein n=1 Tax=Ilex paraguariensis TaxID=185542 RepID=A0ABC8RXS2_9AQUA
MNIQKCNEQKASGDRHIKLECTQWKFQHPIPPKPPDIQKNFASLFKEPSVSANIGNVESSRFDKNSGKNLLSSAWFMCNRSSVPPTLPLVSQSILFPQISQEPDVSHRSSNPPISRSSSLPLINFFGQDSSGIQYPFSIQNSLVPQTSTDPHFSVPRQSSIVNVPSADSSNSSLGNGLLTSAGIPKPAKRVVYNNGEPGMYWTSEETLELSKGFSQTLIGKCAYGKPSLGGHDGNTCWKKRIVKGDEEKGSGQNVEVNLQKEVNIQNGVDHVVTNIADKRKGIVQIMPGGNQKQVYKRKEVVHKPENGNRFSALALDEQSHVVENGEHLIEPAVQTREKSCSHEVEEETSDVSGRGNVEIEGVDKLNDRITTMNVAIEVDQGSKMQMRMSKSGEDTVNASLVVRGVQEFDSCEEIRDPDLPECQGVEGEVSVTIMGKGSRDDCVLLVEREISFHVNEKSSSFTGNEGGKSGKMREKEIGEGIGEIVCCLNKQASLSSDSSFFVDRHYDVRQLLQVSQDDNDGLVKGKELLEKRVFI